MASITTSSLEPSLAQLYKMLVSHCCENPLHLTPCSGFLSVEICTVEEDLSFVVLKCLFIFSFLEKYSREEVRYPVSVEQGAEGEAAKQVRNASRVPLKYSSISWEREHKFITLSRWNSQDGGVGLGTILIFQTRPSLLSGDQIVRNLLSKI